jgi:hypothetical protein
MLTNKVVEVLSPAQVKAIPPESFQLMIHFPMLLRDESLAALSVEQLAEWNADALCVLRSEQWLILLRQHGDALINSLHVDKLSKPTLSVIVALRSRYIPDVIPYSGYLPSDPATLARLSWLQVTTRHLPESRKITAKMIAAIKPPSFAGFRPDMVTILTPDAFGAVRPLQGRFIGNDTISAFSAEHFLALPIAVIRELSVSCWASLNASVIQKLAKEHIHAMPVDRAVFDEMRCEHIPEFKHQQLSWMPDTLQTFYKMVCRYTFIKKSTS